MYINCLLPKDIKLHTLGTDDEVCILNINLLISNSLISVQFFNHKLIKRYNLHDVFLAHASQKLNNVEVPTLAAATSLVVPEESKSQEMLMKMNIIERDK